MPDHDRSVALGLLASNVKEGAPSGRLMKVKEIRERHPSVPQPQRGETTLRSSETPASLSSLSARSL